MKKANKVHKLIMILAVMLCVSMAAIGFTACGSNDGDGAGSTDNFNSNKNIIVISRDANSGTREAFTEKVFPGNKTADVTLSNTTVFSDSTASVLANVQEMTYAIAYDSLGYVTNDVKAIKVDGVEPTTANIANGSYKLQRPFVMTAGKAESAATMSAQELDFLKFIKSTQAQTMIEEEGYVKTITATTAYTAANLGGTLKIWGSTSVNPLMTKLTAKYESLNTANATRCEVGGSGSGDGEKIGNGTAGTTTFADANFGMMSKSAAGLNQVWSLDIAIDGVAIIVNKDNPIENITMTNQLANVYGRKWKNSAGVQTANTGNEITKWSTLLAA